MTARKAELIALSLTQLRAGVLPADRPIQEFGGPGESFPCALCGLPVSEAELEIEAVYRSIGALHFHVACEQAL